MLAWKQSQVSLGEKCDGRKCDGMGKIRIGRKEGQELIIGLTALVGRCLILLRPEHFQNVLQNHSVLEPRTASHPYWLRVCPDHVGLSVALLYEGLTGMLKDILAYRSLK